MMRVSQSTRLAVALAGAVGGTALLAGCASGADEGSPGGDPQPSPVSQSPSPAPTGAESADPNVAAPAGSYIDAATYQQDPAGFAAKGDVVLFFNASWCPTCQAAQANFTGSAVPSGLTLVSVDFDDSAALRQQYGVTVQHTFVQVDAAGAALAKWTGSTTADQVAAKTV